MLPTGIFVRSSVVPVGTASIPIFRIVLDAAPKSVVSSAPSRLMLRGVRAIVTIRGAGMRWPLHRQALLRDD